jgi:hypothetical protein
LTVITKINVIVIIINYYLKTCNLESFGENVRLHSVIIPRRCVKCGKAAVDIHTVSYIPYTLRGRERDRERVNE